MRKDRRRGEGEGRVEMSLSAMEQLVLTFLAFGILSCSCIYLLPFYHNVLTLLLSLSRVLSSFLIMPRKAMYVHMCMQYPFEIYKNSSNS